MIEKGTLSGSLVGSVGDSLHPAAARRQASERNSGTRARAVRIFRFYANGSTARRAGEILPVTGAARLVRADRLFAAIGVVAPFQLRPLLGHEQPRVVPGQGDSVTDFVFAQVDAVDALSMLPGQPHFHVQDSRSNSRTPESQLGWDLGFGICRATFPPS